MGASLQGRKLPQWRLGIIAALLLAVAGCSGADETPTADEASPTQAAPDATVSETQAAANGANGALTILSGAAADEGDTDIGVFDVYLSEVQVRPGDALRFENGSGAIPVPHTVTLGTGADVGTNLPPPVAEGVGQVPAVWGTCVSQEPLAPEDTDCPHGVNEGNDPHVVSFGGDVGPDDRRTSHHRPSHPATTTPVAPRSPACSAARRSHRRRMRCASLRQAATPTCARSTPAWRVS